MGRPDWKTVLSASLAAHAWLCVPAALAAPEPALAPRSWELELEFHDPQRIEVHIPGTDRPTVFWYVVYSVTNRTGRDIQFIPTFEIVTNKHVVYRSDMSLHPAVYKTIKTRHAKTHPFLVEPVDMLGRLLQGEDNTRSSVAIWSAFDADEDLDRFTLFVGGLSGEIAKVQNPSFDASKPTEDKNPRFFVLRKTLEVNYTLPGSLKTQQRVKPMRGERGWVMR